MWYRLFLQPHLITNETVARKRSASLLSEFGLGHVREYAPFALILSALHLILRAKSQHILVNVREWHFVQHSQTMLKCNILPNKMGIFENR